MRPIKLDLNDLPDLLNLQDRIVARYGGDRIWVHEEKDLREFFRLGEDFLALGVRDGSGLTAASLSRRMDPSEVTPLIPSLSWAGEPAHIGLNTLSLPGPGAGPQMIRLLRARRDHLRCSGVNHLFGGIAPDHAVSLGCALRAGAIGVGHLQVPGATEFLLWHGPGAPRSDPDGPGHRVPASDLTGQARLMRAGLALVGLDPEERSVLLFKKVHFQNGGDIG